MSALRIRKSPLLQREQGRLRAERHALADPGRVPTRQARTASPSGPRPAPDLAAAAAPAGSNAAVTSLKDQSRQAYASVAGDKTAAAVFGAAQGDVVGPVQSDFGWVVVKVDSVKAGGGKTLDQARAEMPASSTSTSEKARSKISSTRYRMQSTRAAITMKRSRRETAGDQYAADHRQRNLAGRRLVQAARGAHADPRKPDSRSPRMTHPRSSRSAAMRAMRWFRPGTWSLPRPRRWRASAVRSRPIGSTSRRLTALAPQPTRSRPRHPVGRPLPKR